eukprot:NODE_631_length_5203_cov_0.313480.p6 type:complete len:114 gc:universal NODE_631_length_5203_cov_0.313480:1026-685(-)
MSSSPLSMISILTTLLFAATSTAKSGKLCGPNNGVMCKPGLPYCVQRESVSPPVQQKFPPSGRPIRPDRPGPFYKYQKNPQATKPGLKYVYSCESAIPNFKGQCDPAYSIKPC